MRESIEKFKTRKESKEKSVVEKLKEFKEEEMKKMKEDKTYRSPWLHIEPEHLTEDVQDLYAHFDKGEYEPAKGKLEEVSEKIKGIKKEDVKSSNERFVHWIDDQIGEKLANKELKEDKEKDNY
ncbi:MAG: hypothetical protein ACOZAL_02995 [Patescibacteria group bacterium]